MGKYFIIIPILFLSVVLQAQVKNSVMSSFPPIVVELKHELEDSLDHVDTEPVFENKRLRNLHIENPAIRYAIEFLKKNPYKYHELDRYIRVLIGYAENRYVRRSIDYMKEYFETMPLKEEAISKLKEKIRQDSIYLYSQFPGLDSLYFDANKELARLVYFVEHDEDYQWLRKKSTDAVLLTLQTAKNKTRKVWLNDGKSKFFHFMAENFLGDTIGSWMQVYPNDYKIRIFLDENVFQIRKYVETQEYWPEEFIPRPDSLYDCLASMTLGKLRRNYWFYYTDVAFAFGQGYISDTWSAGGESSLSILSDLKFFLNYIRNSFSWENTFRYRLGMLKNGDEALSKNEDKFELQSKAGLKAFRHWNYAMQLDMNTLFFRSYDSPERNEVIGAFLSPVNVTLSLGLDFKPKSNISLYLSPIAGQWIHVQDTALVDPTRYGIEAGKKTKSDAGAKIELKNTHDLWNFLKVDNRVILFSSYYDKPEYITLDWQVTLNFQVNYFMQTSIYMNSVYDRHYSKKIQFKETLGIGVNFRF